MHVQWISEREANFEKDDQECVEDSNQNHYKTILTPMPRFMVLQRLQCVYRSITTKSAESVSG